MTEQGRSGRTAMRRDSSPSHDPETADLKRDLENVLQFRDDLNRWEIDRKFENNNGTIIHAVDANLLAFLFLSKTDTQSQQVNLSPREIVRSKDPFVIFEGPAPASDPNNMGELEEGASSASMENEIRPRLLNAQHRMGQILVNFLLAGEGVSSRPMLLLPGHDIEAMNAYQSLIGRLADNQRQVDELRGKIHIEFERLMSLSTNPDTDLPASINFFIDEVFPNLLEIELPHLKFKSFTRLFGNRRLVSTSVAASIESIRRVFGKSTDLLRWSPSIDPAVLSDDNRGDEIAFWGGLIGNSISRRYKAFDKLALGELDKLNYTLVQRGQANVKVILWTTNRALIEAGKEYKPFKNNPRADSSIRNLSFSDLFLRHPISLLDFPAFSRPAEARSKAIISGTADDWFDALLGVDDDLSEIIMRSSEDRSAWLTEKLRTIRHLRPALHIELGERWINYLNGLSVESLLSSGAESVRWRETLSTATDSFKENAEKVQAMLSRFTLDSWNEFFKVAAGTGLELLASGLTAHPIVYAVPPLVLVGGEGGNRSQLMKSLWRFDEVRSEGFSIQGKIEECFGSEPRQKSPAQHYVELLAYGILFAFSDRWPITKLIAERAVAQSKLIKDKNLYEGSDREEVIDGREAYYLLAVATRICAVKRDEYAVAASALEKAVELFRRNDRKKVFTPRLTGLRFVAESIAIRSSRLGKVMADRGKGVVYAEDKDEMFNIISSIPREIKSAAMCEEEFVCAHARAMMRSEYFFISLLLNELERGGLLVERETANLPKSAQLQEFVSSQIEDLRVLYSNPLQLPLRARILLRAGATLGGCLDEVDGEWVKLPTEIESLYDTRLTKVRAVDFRRLKRIESMLELYS